MMKKIFLLSLVVALGTLTMSAQKGMWLGGTLGVWHDGDADKTGYSITPEFGMKLSGDWDFGVALGYAKDYKPSVSTGFLSANSQAGIGQETFSVSPFVRYNFLFGKLGGLFLDGGVSYANIKTEGIDDSTDYYNVGIRPGVKVVVSSNFCLIGKFGFLGYEKTGDADGNYGLSLDMNNVQLGVVYTF